MCKTTVPTTTQHHSPQQLNVQLLQETLNNNCFAYVGFLKISDHTSRIMLLDLTYARAQGAALFLGLPHSWLQCASLVWFLLTFTGQMLSLFLCIALCYTGNPVIIAALCL